MDTTELKKEQTTQISSCQQSCSSTQTNSPIATTVTCPSNSTLASQQSRQNCPACSGHESGSTSDYAGKMDVTLPHTSCCLVHRMNQLVESSMSDERDAFSTAFSRERAEFASLIDRSEMPQFKAHWAASLQAERERTSLQLERQRNLYETRLIELRQDLARERAELNTERGRCREMSIRLNDNSRSQTNISSKSFTDLLDGQRRLMKAIEKGKESQSEPRNNRSTAINDRSKINNFIGAENNAGRRNNSTQATHGGNGDCSYEETHSQFMAVIHQELGEMKRWMVGIQKDVNEAIAQTDRLQRTQLIVTVFLIGIAFSHIANACGSLPWTAILKKEPEPE